MSATPDAPLCAAPDPRPRAPARQLPKLRCDTHLHICGPESQFPYAADRIYTPPDALLPAYLHLAETLGIERVIFIQPSVYGTDNRCLLQAMADCPIANRGIAVLDSQVTDEELHRLNREGVRGVRMNLVDVADPGRGLPVAAIRRLAGRIAPLQWHLELLVHVDDHPDLDELLADLPVDIVVGHLGYLRPGATPEDPGFQALLRLLKAGRCWTKLTGPYRICSAEYPYSPVRALAAVLANEVPDRLLWGTDWPHVMMKTAMPNDGDLLDLLFDWVADFDIARRILVDNPARLYGF